MRLTYAEMAACLQVKADSSVNPLVTSVATDNRQVKPGSFFVCIPGERVDGHNFAADAVSRGAVLVLAQKPLPDIKVPVIVVPDSVKALGAIAALWRSRLSGKVIAVTGTCGKTTVKESLGQVLATTARTARTTLNHNNQIGMPCDLLNTDGDEAFYVMEAGISHEGDMDELGEILTPDLALIVNAGAGHTEGLGKQGVAWHKTRLLAHLAPQGWAFVSSDYPDLKHEASLFGNRVEFFSIKDTTCPIRGSYLGIDSVTGHGRYAVTVGDMTGEICAPFSGEYGAENVIAVAACAIRLGLTMEQVTQGFAQIQLPPQRFNHLAAGAWHVHDDTYNANPLSMQRMLHAVAGMRDGRALVFVLGAMGELGNVAESSHEALGRQLASIAPDAVFWKGPYFDSVKRGLGNVCPLLHVATCEDFASAWQEKGAQTYAAGGNILFKGSRSNHLETYLQEFLKQVQGATPATAGSVDVL